MAAASPAAASAQTDHNVQGGRAAVTTLSTNPDTLGAASTTSFGAFAHLCVFTSQSTEQFTQTSSTGFTFTGAVTLACGNGDELFGTISGQGVNFSPTVSVATDTITVTGGTGKFTGATGTVQESIFSKVLSSNSDSVTTREVASISGTLTY